MTASSYENPYDDHLGYRKDLLDLGPRFAMRTGHMMSFWPSSPRRILDVGCGDGFFLQVLAGRGIVADGLDGSAQAIATARERVGHLGGRIECCFIEDFEPEEPYDLLLCGEVLEHIEDDRAFLRQMHRLGAPGARLILTVPLDMALWSKADEEAGHFRRYTREELFEKMEAAGFMIDDYVVWGFPLTRYLTPFIRRQQTDMMHGNEAKKSTLSKYKKLLKPVKHVFRLDNLFNFTERGCGIVVCAHTVHRP